MQKVRIKNSDEDSESPLVHHILQSEVAGQARVFLSVTRSKMALSEKVLTCRL